MVESVTSNGPAEQCGLKKGDFLVQFQDDLAIFLSHQDIMDKLNSCHELQLGLEIERGSVQPMTLENEVENTPKKVKKQEEKFTIILDKQRGIYHC